MTAADIPLGQRLVTQAQWNQVPGDWERMLAMQPEGCFVAEVDGTAVGTTVACLFEQIAWVAMVLVNESWRGQGIGTALVEHALNFCDAAGVCSVRLDATELGRPIYERLGFETQYALTRFAGRLPPAHVFEVAARVSAAQPADYPRLMALDRKVTNTDRSKFLGRLFAESPANVRWMQQDQHVLGWMTVRRGRQAWQLGPCLAEAHAGEVLLKDAAARLGGESVYFDSPLENSQAIRWANSVGLSATRHFVRMYRGKPVNDHVIRLWASSGPELG